MNSERADKTNRPGTFHICGPLWCIEDFQKTIMIVRQAGPRGGPQSSFPSRVRRSTRLFIGMQAVWEFVSKEREKLWFRFQLNILTQNAAWPGSLCFSVLLFISQHQTEFQLEGSWGTHTGTPLAFHNSRVATIAGLFLSKLALR